VGLGLELLAHDRAQLALRGLAEWRGGAAQGSEQLRTSLGAPMLVLDAGQVVVWVLDQEHDLISVSNRYRVYDGYY
jgi:hypothetical protein